MLSLRDSILSTLCYFDLFEFPLTRSEIERWLWRQMSQNRSELLAVLDEGVAVGAWEYHDGYYGLPGRLSLLSKRSQGTRLAAQKLVLARRAIRWLSWIPGVRAIFVTNTVASGWPTPTSDIDLCVVTRHGFLWLTRFLVLAALEFLGVRTHVDDTTDKLCPCFFLSDASLSLEAVTVIEPDIYLTYWILQTIPVYDPENIHEQFLDENKWANTYVPSGRRSFEPVTRVEMRARPIGLALRRMLALVWQTPVGVWAETQARLWQAKRVNAYYGPLRDLPDSRVVLNDYMLKFHKNDRRLAYRDAWIKQCKEKGLVFEML